MSVISESKAGDKIFIIGNFICSQYEVPFNWDSARDFSIGEEVQFIDYYKNMSVNQEHISWQIKFKANDGNIYSATQLYFVTEQEWIEIVDAIKK